MLLKSAEFHLFRNNDTAKLDFTDGMNLIYGDNGAGKTNVLEAIFFFAAGKSFRGSKEREMIRFGENECRIGIDFRNRNGKSELAVKLSKKEKIHRFALAHHADDNAETDLFRTVRGTTVSGLAGIPIERELYVRPLLNVSKAEILGYAAENNIPFVTDSTNDSTDYTRNYIRHTLMPAIKVLNPSATDAFNRLSRYAAEDEAMLEGLLPVFCQKQAGHDLHPAILRRTVARNHQKVVGTGLCYQHLDTITEAVLSRQNTRITLPGGYECITEQGTFWFRKAISAPQAVTYDGILEQNNVAVQEGKVLICCGRNHEFPDAFPKNKFVYNLSTEIILSSKGICGKIRYRTRLPGDRLNLRGVNRSIKKLMSESKIPLSVRALIPVFYDDLGVLAVPFAGVADRVYGAGENAFRIAIYFAEDGV